MSKPRVAIPLSIQFSVRYVLRTGLLKLMADFSKPVILLGWNDPQLKLEFEEAGAEVHSLPIAQYGRQYSWIKNQMDLLFQDRLNSPSTIIDRRRNYQGHSTSRKFRNSLKQLLFRAKQWIPGYSDRLRQKELYSVWQDTNITVFDTLLRELQIDMVFSLTPFLAQEQLLLRAAVSQQLPMIASILSFDNLTTRNWIPVVFNQYLLWNKYNAAELYRAYPETINRSVLIVGAPQFDFYSNAECMISESEWRRQLSIPSGKKVILFGGTGKHIALPETEIALQIDQAIACKKLVHDAVLLIRRHPNDPVERWEHVRHHAKHVVWDEPWEIRENLAHTNILFSDIARLAASLKHSNVHVNISSTMTIDGAIFDRPQIGPAYDPENKRKQNRIMKELYLREHYLPITNSGGLNIVHSFERLLEAINDGLNNPHRQAAGRRKLLEEICTYVDGQATRRVADALRNFCAELNTNARGTSH